MSNKNNRIGSKSAQYVRIDNNGMFVTPGPFVGIVKNNYDPTCSGRLQVYIPQLGAANEDDPGSWITVNYASPFRGQTKRRIDVSQYIDKSIDSNADINSTTENSFQSYGFWFVPPDINIKVLCIFVNGDPSQGYWTGCIQDAFDSHMVPASGSSAAVTSQTSGGYIWDPSKYATHKDLQSYIELTSGGSTEIPQRLPTAEAVLSAQTNVANVNKVQMVPLVYQTKQLAIQGLVFDQGRGTTTASALRESPSQVFGFSSPGRLSVFKDAKTSAALLSLVSEYVNNSGNVSSTDQSTVTTSLSNSYRTGGHQIVLDDGSVEGKDQGIRIRSASGNMILLDDTNGQIYVINAPGTAWIEMTPTGKIDIFANSDFSLRSKGNINFHSDQNILFNAKSNILMHADSKIQLDSGADFSLRSVGQMMNYSEGSLQFGSNGTLNLSSAGNFGVQSGATLNLNGTTTNINGGSGTNVADPGKLTTNSLIDTALQSGSNVWWQSGKITSIVTRAPAHEPWPNHEINSIVTVDVQQGTIINSSVSSIAPSSGVRGTPKSNNINAATVAKQPDPTTNLCGLTSTQTKALLAQIGQQESNGNYNTTNSLGFVGKYQFGAAALEDQGYLVTGSSKTGTNKQVISNSSNWTGKNGCNSQTDWLSNPSAQEMAMQSLVQKNCNYLKKVGVITSSTSASDIGGYLGVAQLLGAGNAVKYNKYLNGQGEAPTTDAFGTSAQTVFTTGSNAVGLGTNISNA